MPELKEKTSAYILPARRAAATLTARWCPCPVAPARGTLPPPSWTGPDPLRAAPLHRPGRGHSLPGAQRLSAAAPIWKQHRLKALLYLLTPEKAASGGAGNGCSCTSSPPQPRPLSAVLKRLARPRPALRQHAARGLPHLLRTTPSSLRPQFFSRGLPAPPRSTSPPPTHLS